MRVVVKEAPTKSVNSAKIANFLKVAKHCNIVNNVKSSERERKSANYANFAKIAKNCLKVVREMIKKVPTKSANSSKYVKFINNVKCSEGGGQKVRTPHEVCKFCENRKTLQNSSTQKKQ